MIPWIESHSYFIGPLKFQTWGTFVAAGFLVSGWITARRAKSKGLDPKHIWDMLFWIFIAAMIGSRIFHVLFYDPGYYFVHPWEALDPRQPGWSIMGGLLAATAMAWFYTKRKSLDFIAYADTMAWGLPWGCGIGRIGCFLIHDHPGTLSSFVLAVKYPDGQSRHDLGLYLSLIGFVVGLLFLWLGRKTRPRGFFVAIFFLLDGISRLSLDFLRIADRRIFYLTPAQWVAMVMIGGSGYILLSHQLRTSA